MVIIDNKSERNENKRENFIYTDRALLQQITLFEEKKKKKQSYPGWPTPLTWPRPLPWRAEQERFQDLWSPHQGESTEEAPR